MRWSSNRLRLATIIRPSSGPIPQRIPSQLVPFATLKTISTLSDLTSQFTASTPLPRQVAADIANKLDSCAHSTSHPFNPNEVKALALAFARSSYPDGVLNVLAASQRSGTKLNLAIYEAIANHLAQSCAWEQISPLVSLALRQTLKVSRRLLNRRIQSLIQLEHFAHLTTALDDFTRRKLKPDRETYHLLMRGHILNNNLPKAQESIDWMIDAGFPVSAKTQAEMISVFNRAMGPGTEIENLAIGALCDADPSTEQSLLNGLVGARVAAGDTDGVFRFLSMFNLILEDHLYLPPGLTISTNAANRPSPNVHTYMILLRFFLKRRELHQFELVSAAFLTRGFPVNINFVSLVVRSAIIRGNFRLAGAILQTLCSTSPLASAKLSCIAGSYGGIPNWLSQQIRSLSPNASIFNAFLEEWLPKNGFRNVKSLLLAMEIAVGGPNLKTIGILIRYMSRFRGVQPAYVLRFLCSTMRVWPLPFANLIYEAILSSALRAEIGRNKGRGPSKFTKDISQLSHLMVMYHGDHNAFDWGALRVPSVGKHYLVLLLDSLQQKGVRLSPAGYALKIRYQAMIQMDMYEAERTISEMRSQEMKVNHFHYSSLVEGYVNTRQMDDALRIAQRFSQQARAEVLYTIIVHGYARQGQPHKAQAVFDDMVRERIRPDWAAVDAVVGAWHRNGHFTVAKEKLIELWPFVSESKPSSPSDTAFSTLLQEFRKLRYLHEPHYGEIKVTKARFGTMMQRKYGSMLSKIVKFKKSSISK